MKLIYRITKYVIVVVLVAMSCHYSITAHSEFVLGNVSESTDDCEKLSEKINLTYFETEISGNSITRFNVSDKGLIALGFQKIGTNYINVYSQEGVFLYGYSFDVSSAFGLDWDEDNLSIYLVRSNVLITLDDKGTCIKVADISANSDNDHYSRELLTMNRKNTNGKEYLLKNDSFILNIFSSAYSQLVCIDESGKETIIYNSDIMSLIEPLITVAMIIIFSVVICVKVKGLKKSQGKDQKTDDDSTSRRNDSQTNE